MFDAKDPRQECKNLRKMTDDIISDMTCMPIITFITRSLNLGGLPPKKNQAYIDVSKLLTYKNVFCVNFFLKTSIFFVHFINSIFTCDNLLLLLLLPVPSVPSVPWSVFPSRGTGSTPRAHQTRPWDSTWSLWSQHQEGGKTCQKTKCQNNQIQGQIKSG